MELIIRLFALITALLGITLMLGLYKPWVVFWWADFANRLKVLKVYGTLFLIVLVSYWVLKSLF